MTREQARGKRRRAWDRFIGVSIMVLGLSAIEDYVAELDGVAWDVLRTALVAAMAVALVILVVAFARERRTPEAEPEAG